MANFDSRSGCALDHAPRVCDGARYEYVQMRSALSDAHQGGGFPQDVLELSESMIMRVAQRSAKLRIMNAKKIHDPE